MIGVYLHGSLAMGCFNPATSDIDLLVVTRHKIPITTKKSLVELLLFVSGSPQPVEISFLDQGDLVPWRHPTPFDLHYSEDWRKSFSEDLATNRWKHLDEQPQTDPDLAAHITVMRQRGIALWGEAIQTVFPPVPREDYLASIISDLKWARERLGQDAGLAYGVLNSCRVYAYHRAGRIYSKDEAAVWALSHLPPEYHHIIRSALETYHGEYTENHTGDQKMAERLMAYVLAQAAG